MPRKTSLRLLSERVVPDDGEDGERSVIEAFPSAPAVADPVLADDILDILRKSHEKFEVEARQATAVATAAVERVDSALTRIEATEGLVKATAAKTEQIEQGVATATQSVVGQVSALLEADRKESKVKAANIALGLDALGERLSQVLIFLIGRLPALLALAAAIWLWHGVLDDPKPLQLVALGLFGAVVIAPAMWLGGWGKKNAL